MYNNLHNFENDTATNIGSDSLAHLIFVANRMHTDAFGCKGLGNTKHSNKTHAIKPKNKNTN